MARSKSKVRVHSSLSSGNAETGRSERRNVNDQMGPLMAAESLIQEVRERLMVVEAVLHCAAISLDSDEDRAEGPHHPTVINFARALVTQSIDQLGPDRWKQILETSDLHRLGVRESAPVYMQ
jgi:hypothetical protein